MSDIVCVTASKLCSKDFFEQLDRIAKAKPKFIILREKDVSEEDYTALAEKAANICQDKTEMVLHFYWKSAINLGKDSIHLPLYIFRMLNDADKSHFRRIGVSCHSVEDAVEAQNLGASYITAGHIFATDCKKGLAPRGVGFLRDICISVDIPVYAIGGISPDNIDLVRECGVAGACVMSGFMRCEDPSEFISEFDRK
ncbi:thiamine phosphate synthase [Ruminococcus sp.]|uniref:thiamine phosphate synthase n=1 Tax=Ruminococcus sp. TaxID=41978 RepID=UPI0025CEA6C6|nr:thiamine phosphate synthase [Ruminococcus sp.]MBO4524445.1 thiamine phosphate synthase [Ruminococcus sp.]